MSDVPVNDELEPEVKKSTASKKSKGEKRKASKKSTSSKKKSASRKGSAAGRKKSNTPKKSSVDGKRKSSKSSGGSKNSSGSKKSSASKGKSKKKSSSKADGKRKSSKTSSGKSSGSDKRKSSKKPSVDGKRKSSKGSASGKSGSSGKKKSGKKSSSKGKSVDDKGRKKSQKKSSADGSKRRDSASKKKDTGKKSRSNSSKAKRKSQTVVLPEGENVALAAARKDTENQKDRVRGTLSVGHNIVRASGPAGKGGIQNANGGPNAIFVVSAPSAKRGQSRTGICEVLTGHKAHSTEKLPEPPPKPDDVTAVCHGSRTGKVRDITFSLRDAQPFLSSTEPKVVEVAFRPRQQSAFESIYSAESQESIASLHYPRHPHERHCRHAIFSSASSPFYVLPPSLQRSGGGGDDCTESIRPAFQWSEDLPPRVCCYPQPPAPAFGTIKDSVLVARARSSRPGSQDLSFLDDVCPEGTYPRTSNSQWQPGIAIPNIPIPMCSDRHPDKTTVPYEVWSNRAVRTVPSVRGDGDCVCEIPVEERCIIDKPAPCMSMHYSWVPIYLPGEPEPEREIEPEPEPEPEIVCPPCISQPDTCALKKAIITRLRDIECIRNDVCHLQEQYAQLNAILIEKQCCFEELVEEHRTLARALTKEFSSQDRYSDVAEGLVQESQETSPEVAIADRAMYHLQQLAHKDFRGLQGFSLIQEALMFDKVKTLRVWYELSKIYNDEIRCLESSHQKSKQAFYLACNKAKRIKKIREQVRQDLKNLQDENERELQRISMEDQSDRQEDQIVLVKYKEQLQEHLVIREDKYEKLLDRKDLLLVEIKPMVKELKKKYRGLVAVGTEAIESLDAILKVEESKKLSKNTNRLVKALPSDVEYHAIIRDLQKLLTEYVRCMTELEMRRAQLLHEREQLVGPEGCLLERVREPPTYSPCDCVCVRDDADGAGECLISVFGECLHRQSD